MIIEFTRNFKEDFDFWKEKDKKICNKIMQIINSLKDSPFTGIGKPEPLKYEFSGCWSRRINKEYRIIYRVVDKTIQLLACRYHYK